MEDIISHGRPPRRGWRRRAVPVAVVVAVAALVVVEHIGHGGAGRQGRPGREAAAGKARGARHEAPTGLGGTLGEEQPWLATARMPRTGVQPAWFLLASGDVQSIGGLPGYGLGYAFTRIQGGWVLQPKLGGRVTCGDCSQPTSSVQAGCGSCPGPPTAAYYLGNHARAVTTIGVATMVAPAARGLVWLTTFPTSSGLGTAAGVAREYDSAGTAVGQAVRLPVGYKIVQATGEGLLLTAVADGPRPADEQLWNPASRKVIAVFRRVLAASASELAFGSQCASSCSVRVVDLVTGYDHPMRLAHGYPVTGEFSPDGRYLALEVRGFEGRRSRGSVPGARVEVADLTSGRVVVVPGTAVSGSAVVGFGWPGDGDYLAAKLTSGARVRITYWSAAAGASVSASVSAVLDPTELVTG